MNQQVENWEEADDAIRRMGEIIVALTDASGELTLKINKLKEEVKQGIAGLESERKYLEEQITHFCESQKAEFAKKRSKVLNFGLIGFRISSSVPIPRDRGKLSDLIATLKHLRLDSCIKVEEKIDRDQISTLDDGVIAKLGLKKTVKDSFRIQPNLEKIQDLKHAS
ncbi:hypothetical protein S1OALGB6SA_41 [Olavius algarvensis spirochete endosymbiont]|uniref:host-nuclease inhibitor Gam family protein n=1 Tax=Olavius algarvensis spirochete endosymbiont TaxID=260710 RepID=UPI000F26A229|nr:host-nuclease inhibitor Gam family protein [Olavius algarvensis spirochete endosymbiont]VDA98979.1 hypothetical protein S1OALGB6SA_41 [Olavius algarvensis spirochete endosymbiont]